MGLEANSELHLNGQTVQVKALLESHDLILRGPVKKTLALRELSDPRVVGDQLLFEHAGEPYALTLPAGQAATWLKKMTSEPPTLASKLGVDGAHKAYVRGETTDVALSDALSGATTKAPHEAALGIAIVASPEDLSGALVDLLDVLPATPIWIIFPKGAKSPLPESAVRSHMHALGLVDTKSCAVSDVLTAARFNRRKGNPPASA